MLDNEFTKKLKAIAREFGVAQGRNHRTRKNNLMYYSNIKSDVGECNIGDVVAEEIRRVQYILGKQGVPFFMGIVGTKALRVLGQIRLCQEASGLFLIYLESLIEGIQINERM